MGLHSLVTISFDVAVPWKDQLAFERNLLVITEKREEFHHASTHYMRNNWTKHAKLQDSLHKKSETHGKQLPTLVNNICQHLAIFTFQGQSEENSSHICFNLKYFFAGFWLDVKNCCTSMGNSKSACYCKLLTSIFSDDKRLVQVKITKRSVWAARYWKHHK